MTKKEKNTIFIAGGLLIVIIISTSLFFQYIHLESKWNKAVAKNTDSNEYSAIIIERYCSPVPCAYNTTLASYRKYGGKQEVYYE